MSFWSDIDWGNVADKAVKYAPTVIGAIGAYNAQKNASGKADYASDQEEALRGTELGLRQQQIGLATAANARSDQLFGEFGTNFLPAQRQGVQAQQKVLDIASKPIDPNVEASTAGADFAAADATARGTLQRQQQSVGIAPNSGQALEQSRQAGLSSVAGKTAAMTNARRSAVTTRLSRMSAAAAPLANAGNSLLTGSGQFAQAANTGANQAAAGLSLLSGDYGADANAASAAAGKAGSSLGDSAATLLEQIYADYKAKTDPLQPVKTTPKPMTNPDGSPLMQTLPVKPGTTPPNAAGGEAATSYGLDNAPAGTAGSFGRDTSGYLGGPASISNGLQSLNYNNQIQDFATKDWASLNNTLNNDPNIKGAGLSTVGKIAGGAGSALDVYSGIKEGGVKGYGAAVKGAADLAQLAGFGGTTTGVAGTVGSLASGNVGGAIQGATSLAQGASGATGAAASSALGTLGTVAAGAGLAAAFIGAAKLAVHAFAGGASKDRNQATFTSALGDNLKTVEVGKTGGGHYMAPVRMYNIPGKGWVDAKTFNDIAGAWYGATVAPDGDREGWTKKLQGIYDGATVYTSADQLKNLSTPLLTRNNDALATMFGG